jgi:SAM-dependent methyltransferase
MSTPDDYFGSETAAVYDDPADPMNSPEMIEPVVDRLTQLARGGRVLEFAIGTGRIAVPLAARGVEVHGIELSDAMVAQLRAKPGAASVRVVIGDMSRARVAGEFSLVYLVFNTIMNLTSQAAQTECFANAAAHLTSGGYFVIETMVPQLSRLSQGERFLVFDAGGDHWGIDEYDTVNQGLVSHHFSRRDENWTLDSGPFRYVWPAELDLMAHMAGMALVERSSDWKQSPFTAGSPSHVSVWQKPPV